MNSTFPALFVKTGPTRCVQPWADPLRRDEEVDSAIRLVTESLVPSLGQGLQFRSTIAKAWRRHHRRMRLRRCRERAGCRQLRTSW